MSIISIIEDFSIFYELPASYDEQNSSRDIREGDIFNLKITDVGAKGDGIGNIEGMVVFVKRTTEADIGKEFKVRIINTKDTYAFAEVLGQ